MLNVRRSFFMLIIDCIEEFEADCQIRALSPRTIKGYVNNNILFSNFLLAEYNINDVELVKPAHIKAYAAYMLKTNHKSTYVNDLLKCLRAFYKYLKSEDLIKENPTEKTTWAKEGKTLISTFTDSEVKRMINSFSYINYLEARNKTLLILAFDTGMRNTEMCVMQHSDINQNYILVHGKGDKQRIVPISPYLKKALMRYERIKKAYFKNRNTPNNFFLSRTGRPLTKEALEHIWHEAGERAGVRREIRCSPHTSRHYYAQANLRNGLDIYSLSRLMGHCSVNITKTYLQSIQDEQIIDLACDNSPLMNLSKNIVK